MTQREFSPAGAIDDVVVVHASVLPSNGAARPGAGVGILRALAEEPRAVVYDLGGLDGHPEVVSAAFDTIDDYLSDWAGTPLLLCTADPDLWGALGAHRLAAHAPLCADLQTAVAAAHRRPAADRETLGLEPVPAAVRAARTFVGGTLLGWGARSHVDPAAVVISELMTPLLPQTSATLTVSVSRSDASVRLAVRDSGNPSANLRHEAGTSIAPGCGTRLVESLSRAHGTVALEHGRIVWAVLEASPAA